MLVPILMIQSLKYRTFTHNEAISTFLEWTTSRFSLSSFVDKARLALNPASAMCVIGASVPPVIIASASPRCMILNASPIEFVPVAHA